MGKKPRLMQLSFRVFQTCRDKDHLGLFMHRRTRIMKNLVTSVMVGTSQIDMIPLEMMGSWIHLIDEAMDMVFTLVLV